MAKPESIASYWQVTFHAPQAQAQSAADALEEVAAPRVLSLSLFETKDAAVWRVVAHYYTKPAARDVKRIIKPHVRELHLVIDKVPAIDWVKKSLEGLKPVRAGRFTIAISEFAEAPAPSSMAIAIDAGQAFGTGHHGTTLGCLLALDHLARDDRPRRILDLGTGSGILAIAAAKLWRRSVVATDIDPLIVDIARANAKKNGVAPWVRVIQANGFYHPNLMGGRFDVVLANILAAPLVKLAPHMARHLVPGGVVIVSGLLTVQEPWLRSVYAHHHFLCRRRIHLDGWSTLILSRP